MPSFTRRIPSTAPPPLPTLIKTGVPSLDDLLHLPPSSTSLVFSPDLHSTWPRLIARYFTAQAFLSSENVIIVGEDGSSRDLVKGCMWVDERSQGSSKGDESGSEGEVDGGGDNRSKIAWRYGGMEKFRTSIGETGQLNLSTTLPKSIIDQAEKVKGLQYIDIDTGESTPGSSGSSRAWVKLGSALTSLQEILSKQDGKTTTKIIINELGSADWENPSSHEIHRFLHGLRSLVRGRNAVAMITLPPSFIRNQDEESIKRLSWAVDASLEIKGFADDPTLQPIFHPLHGLITLHSFPHTHLLPPTIKYSSLLGLSSGGGGSENNLGFRARRKRWGIETVHLGIDGGVGERRTEPTPEVGRILIAPAPAPVEGAEGVEKAASGNNEAVDGGEVQVKKKEKRARVRFGEDQILEAPAVSVDSLNAGHGHGHQHGHSHLHDHQHEGHNPGHAQGHGHKGPAPRASVRHDRPDLYEF